VEAHPVEVEVSKLAPWLRRLIVMLIAWALKELEGVKSGE
jgi:hypothetical protein